MKRLLLAATLLLLTLSPLVIPITLKDQLCAMTILVAFDIIIFIRYTHFRHNAW